MRIPIALAAAATLAMPTLAAASTTGVVLDGNMPVGTVQMTQRPYTPPLAHKANLPVIFQNFATLYPKGEYNAIEGASLSGVHTLHGQIWLAAAFTPKAAATIKEIAVAASVIASEKNVVAVHLYDDHAGLPGRALWSSNTSLPPFTSCCAITALPVQIPVEAGKQYWVGITTLGGPASTFAGAWNLTVLDQVDGGTAAQNRGNGWFAGASVPNFAFGIYGQ